MLPKNLKFGSKVESAPARSSRSNISPQNGTSYSALGDTIIINIPTRANLVMVPTENYLKFDFSLINAGANPCPARWDSCGAHGLFQRIRIYHGSNLLEDIDNYNLLAKILFDLQVSTDSAYGKMNVLCGTRNDLVVKSPTTATYADTTAVNTAINNGFISAIQVNSGESITVPAKAGTVNGTTTNTYCLNLVSVIGSLCSQNYFPLFACTSAPLRVEIQLVDNLSKAMALLTTTNMTFQISNCEFVANFIELSDVAMSMITQSLEGQPLQFVIPQYKNFASSQWQLGTSTTNISIPVPAKYSSLKSLIASCRDNGLGAVEYMPFSSVSSEINQYSFRVGPNIFPSKAPSRLPEMFAECMKAMGSIADINYQPAIEKTSYTMINSLKTNAGDTTYNNLMSGSFYIGLDLENYSSAPKDTIFAGYNSNTDDIYLNIEYDGQTTAYNPRYDIYACFDCVYVFENNTAYIKF